MTSPGRPGRSVESPALPCPPGARSLLVCIDYEGRWGMPFGAPYDLEASTERILAALARHGVAATFFMVGELATEHPELTRAISSAGHEIALHGWRHERLDRLSTRELVSFGERLAYATAAIETITGTRPAGFRAPYLLAPRFFDAELYALLAGHGFRWASNQEIRHVVELFRPDRLRTGRPWQYLRSHPGLMRGAGARALLLALNANIHGPTSLRREGAKARWLLSGYPPFYRDALLEIPLYSPLDCDLLKFPAPSASSPEPLLDFARFALESCLTCARDLSLLTFHDWIIAGANRLDLLDEVLSFVSQVKLQPVTVEMWWSRLAQRRQQTPGQVDLNR